jgi:hypothetical protein
LKNRYGQVAERIAGQTEVLEAPEAVEDCLGQATNLIVVEMKLRAGTHCVENAICRKCFDALVCEPQDTTLFGAISCSVHDAAAVD